MGYQTTDATLLERSSNEPRLYPGVGPKIDVGDPDIDEAFQVMADATSEMAGLSWRGLGSRGSELATARDSATVETS